MKVFSVATDRVAFLSSLEDSARRFDYDLHVLGRDQKWQGFLWRWTLVLDAVEALDPDEVVSVVDGYDVVLAGPAELLEKLYHNAVPNGDALLFGQEHRQEHSSRLFWFITEIFHQYHAVAPDQPIINAGVCVGTAQLVKELCHTMLAAGRDLPKPDDQKLLNQLVARGAVRVRLHEALHAHCDRRVIGPLKQIVTNMPTPPDGPLTFCDGAVYVAGSRAAGPVTRPITRALVVHGIFSSNLVPVCEKIGVAPPLDEDLGKRTISQPDIRMMRNVVRALTALSVVVWVMSVLVELHKLR